MNRVRILPAMGRRFYGINRVSRLLACLPLLALLAGPGRAAAQVSFNGQTVTAVEFEGLRALPEETVLFYLGLKVGEPFDEASLNRSIHQLWSRNLIDDIRVEAQPAAGGVRLRIRVQERPALRSVTYEGLKRISTSDINERILKDHVGVREGDAVDRGELNRLKGLLEEMYREKRFRFAEVKFAVEQVSPGEARVVCTVNEGDKLRIADIQFEGNTVFGDRRLRWAMKKTKESGPLNRILKKDVYNPATLEEDLAKVRDIYRRSGYKNAAVGQPPAGEPEIEVRALRPEASTARDQKRRLFVTIPIAEGERWKFGEVMIEGNERFGDEVLLRAFRKRGGGWLRSKQIDEGVKQIDEIYKNSGFIYAQVVPELREREGNVADVIVHVNEGDQYRVGRLEFEGNTRTRDKVLRREFRVHEGMFLNIGALKSSVYKVNQLQYFKLDEEDPIQFQNFDTEKKTVDLLVVGEESDRTELQIGGGWSEFDGFFGQFQVRTRNFLGRGETVGVNYQSGRIRDYFDLSYFSPWFLDRPQTIGIQAFSTNEDYTLLAGSDFVQSSQGGVLTYGRSFGLFNSMSLSYTNSSYEDQRTFDFIGTPPEPGPNDPCRFTVGEATLTQTCDRSSSMVRPHYLYDSRDNRMEPTRGTRFTVGFDYAGGFLGGDTYFYRPEIAFSHFHPVSNYPVRTVVGLNAEVGIIEPFDGYELYFLDRYLIGGENSVRGFRHRRIWARNVDGETILDEFGSPQGGDQFAQLNLEYHFLVGGPFRVVLFGDAGAVYGADFCDPALINCAEPEFPDGLRYSAGAEMRIFVPVFGAPLRFIYSKNLDPLPGDESVFESFQFSIGTSF